MNQLRNKKLTAYAQQLRRSMTQEERHLWYDFLKPLPVCFRRQKTIGPYIVDFYCAHAKLVIELDGGQHYQPEHQQQDLLRDEYLHSLGLTVLRFTNLDIKNNFRGVCEHILHHIEKGTIL